MNRKELNMSKNTNNNQTVDEKKGKRTGLTILGYVLVIVALLTVLTFAFIMQLRKLKHLLD